MSRVGNKPNQMVMEWQNFRIRILHVLMKHRRFSSKMMSQKCLLLTTEVGVKKSQWNIGEPSMAGISEQCLYLRQERERRKLSSLRSQKNLIIETWNFISLSNPIIQKKLNLSKILHERTGLYFLEVCVRQNFLLFSN